MTHSFLLPALQGAGLGLRRGRLMDELEQAPPDTVDFLEMAPENWIPHGGPLARRLRALTERYPCVCHGLSLSIGGPGALDEDFVRQVGGFLREHDIHIYSEHLSYCSDDGHLYDLLPIPFTQAAVNYVAERVLRVQDLIGQRIALENVSYYAAYPDQEMSELEFIQAVLQQADCQLLLDVNNIYVNAVNHGYDPAPFLRALPGERMAYLHVAGHHQQAADLIIDTHGAAVIDPVWELLQQAYAQFGSLPTLLERDFNIPPLAELRDELACIRQLQGTEACSTQPVTTLRRQA
ncbi:MAG: DUF692 domain-containing protein [Thiolinea sp.]